MSSPQILETVTSDLEGGIPAKCALVMLILGCASCAVHPPRAARDHVVLRDGDVVRGNVAYNHAEDSYVVSQGEARRVVERRQVVAMSIRKPGRFEQATALMGSGAHDKAIPLLEAVLREYKYRMWDSDALFLLIECYARTGTQPKLTVAAYEHITGPIGRKPTERLTLVYLEALLELGESERAMQVAKRLSAEGIRKFQVRLNSMKSNAAP